MFNECNIQEFITFVLEWDRKINIYEAVDSYTNFLLIKLFKCMRVIRM